MQRASICKRVPFFCDTQAKPTGEVSRTAHRTRVSVCVFVYRHCTNDIACMYICAEVWRCSHRLPCDLAHQRRAAPNAVALIRCEQHLRRPSVLDHVGAVYACARVCVCLCARVTEWQRRRHGTTHVDCQRVCVCVRAHISFVFMHVNLIVANLSTVICLT